MEHFLFVCTLVNVFTYSGWLNIYILYIFETLRDTKTPSQNILESSVVAYPGPKLET